MNEDNKEKIDLSKLPSLKDYIFPNQEYKNYIVDLEIYWQFSNQSSIELYKKFEGKNFFKGSINEMIEYDEAKKLFDLKDGDVGKYLLSTINLIGKYSVAVDLEGLNKAKKEHQIEIIDIISKGQTAYEKLTEWIEPLNKKECVKSIAECSEITMGMSKHDNINIFKLCETKSLSDEYDGIGMFPKILEIDSIEAIIDYFKNIKNPIPDSLIVAFLKDPTYKAPHIYLYLVYKNNFYLLNMDEQNLNQNHTIGLRNKDRYEHWYHFNNFWIPFNAIMKKEKNKSKAITIKEKKIIHQRPIKDIFEIHPEFQVWLDFLSYKILDYFKKNDSKIPLGLTKNQVIKSMLEDKRNANELESNVIIEEIANYSGDVEKTTKMGISFSSDKDSATFLLEKHRDKITDVVPSIEKIPVMIGTRNHIENIIKFEQRKIVAKQLQKLMDEDYKNNKKETYKWISDQIKKKGTLSMIKQGLEDREYSFKHFQKWNEHVDSNRIKLDEKSEIKKRKILSIDNHYNEPNFWDKKNRDIDIFPWENKHFRLDRKRRNVCNICKKAQFFYIMTISFTDYRELLEFFKIKENEIHENYIIHFHGQNNLSSENHIIYDDDPVFTVKDKFFRREKGEDQLIRIFYGLCKRCMKKHSPKNTLNSKEERLSGKREIK